MSSLSPIDSSAYQINNSFFPVVPMDTLPSGMGKVDAVKTQDKGDADTKQNPDLSAYYNNVVSQENSNNSGTNLVKSAQELDNVMISALSNGYSVQSACNMRLAELAYNANARVFESTFEFEI